MRKILLVFLIALSFTNCKNETKSKKAPTEKNLVNIDFIKTFEGKIDNKYDYYIKLESNSGNVSGSYFYKNKCQKIPIKGTIDSNGNVKIKEFGNQNKMSGIFIGKMVNKHKIEGNWSENNNSKKIPFYFIETNESYADALANCKKQRESKILKNLVIDKVQLLKFPATKKGGNPWDNAFSSYKPDIFLKIIDFKKNIIYKENDYSNNITNEDLPLDFKFKTKLKIKEETYKNGLIFYFYDHDSATSNDLLGYAAFNKFKEHFNSKKITQEFEVNGIKLKITFHYE